jgi:tetratricopeptide (TPR) repeat protein
VAHYLIHSFDYPALAHLALPAARSYAGIAPASAQAQHMPSHIFTRLGLWEEAIASDRKAHAAAKAYAIRHAMPGAWDEQLHAMDYLVYAHLQLARDDQARAIQDELVGLSRVDPPNFKVAYAMSAIPARMALERRQWAEAAALTLPAGARAAVPWAKFPWAEAHIHFARAVGLARSGQAKQAAEEVSALDAIQARLPIVPGEYDWGGQVRIERQVAAAWVAFAEGQGERAVELMKAAAELDDAAEKHPVTPGAILPAREQLADLLMELGRPAEGLAEYEASLRQAPGRLAGLMGAVRAADAVGDRRKAREYRAKLPSCGAGCARPELLALASTAR